MSANVFISFASQDRKVAIALCEALETRGFSCWISSRDIAPGDNFQSAIVSAIRDAKVMLLVFTANSNTSDEMTKELALASQQKLIVVPLRVEDVAPSAAFAYEFATRQWIDLFVDWEKAINQLCERLSRAMPPEAPDAVTLAAQPLAPAQAAAPTPVATVPTAAANKTNVGLLVGIGVAVLLLIGVVVALPMLTGKKTSSQAGVAPSAAAPVSAPTASEAPAAASQAVQPQSASAAVASAPAPAQAAPRHTRAGSAAVRSTRLAVDSASDAYICAHGDETDSRTIRACDRKDRGATEGATR